MLLFYTLLVAAGLLGGMLAGLLGIGGGLFFLLVLPDALARLGVDPADAPAAVVVNSLMGTLIAALASCYQHIRSGTPGRGDIAWIGLPTGITAYIALRLIVARPEFDATVFNSIVIVVLGLLLGRSVYSFMQEERRAQREHLRAKGHVIGAGAGIAEVTLPPHRQLLLKGEPLPTGKLAGTGALAGLVSSLTGLGGGILIVPMLRDWAGYPLRRASFVSSGAIVLSSLAALAFSLSTHPLIPIPGAAGYILPKAAFPLGAGVVVAAPLGVRLASKISSRNLTLLYIAFVALVLGRRVAALF